MTKPVVQRATPMLIVLIVLLGGWSQAQKRVRVPLSCEKCDNATAKLLVNEGGKCLDVHSPEMNMNGGRVQVWECKDTPGELWRLKGDLLVNESGKCLQAAPQTINDNGGVVHVWDCNQAATNQQWRMEKGAIISKASGLCLDVHRPDMSRDGGRVQLWTCVAGQPPQLWHAEVFQ